ncbi:fungal-specific transcription factor domain-containing protein [Dactylonectria estremocensis]|uniref:Fungal-specific transcription factor domain-containing protein n=1 Tax=Dactylonectria estremocensis TaxID=1079267 RepID=A0A9P9F189_9HYPO|nr:fungal-specific transcription factor domain-containing protein [Dactylonectria estremocensis]
MQTHEEASPLSQSSARIPGQVCDRCRRRKIRCHGTDEECSPCISAGIICVASTKLRRNRKRKSFYENEGIEQRRPGTLPLVEGIQIPTRVHLSSDAQASSSDVSSQRPIPILEPRTPNFALPASSHLPPLHSIGSNPPVVHAADMPSTRKKKQGDEAVVGHMGRLVSDDRQIAMFGGSSTGVHFISQAEQQMQLLRMHTDAFPSCAYSLHLHNIWDASSNSSPLDLVQAMIANLPPDSTSILETTIDRWTPLYPIFHRGSTMEAFQNLLQNSSLGGEGVVILYQALGLLALGTLGQSGACTRSHYHFLCFSETYYKMAATLLETVLEKPCLQSLQGLEITQLYLQISSRYTVASHIGGIATRLAQNLGLHRHSQRFKFDPLETELRRRVWWCQYSLDVFSSAYHGMPRLIRDQDVDTDLPTRVDHDLLSRTHVEFPLPGVASQVDTALSLFKLSQIVGSTLEKLYTTTRRRGGVAKIKHLQAELEMWERSLPISARRPVQPEENPDADISETQDPVESTEASTNATLEATFLDVALCIATIHIHRPALSFTTAHPQFLPSLEACGRASATLINRISTNLMSFAPLDIGSIAPRTLPFNSSYPDSLLITLLYPNGIHMLWQAGLTIFFARWKGHPVAAEDDEDLIRRCVATLRQLYLWVDDAGGHIRQCAGVLDLLREKTFSESRTPPVTDQFQWNVWDWPMASALELSNMLDVTPLDFYLEQEQWT